MHRVSTYSMDECGAGWGIEDLRGWLRRVGRFVYLFAEALHLKNTRNFEYVTRRVFLKGQSNEIFDLQFCSSVEPAWATDQWVKICLILV